MTDRNREAGKQESNGLQGKQRTAKGTAVNKGDGEQQGEQRSTRGTVNSKGSSGQNHAHCFLELFNQIVIEYFLSVLLVFERASFFPKAEQYG